MEDSASIAAEPGAALGVALDLFEKGGPVVLAIAVLSVVLLAIVLWKLWQFAATGAWARSRAEAAVAAWQRGAREEALRLAEAGHGSCAAVVGAAIRAANDPRRSDEDVRAETTRVARRHLGAAQGGLRGLELIATVAPLLGLLGTVIGMIAAFQALETAGARADPAALAGGIWEALLTTAAGMTVAIPASAALTWFESVIDSLRRDMEDMATRILTTPAPALARAAE